MNEQKKPSRRNFLRQSSLGLSASLFGGVPSSSATKEKFFGNKRLPREICVVSVDLVGLWPDKTMESRLKKMFERMEAIAGLQPDVACLPELFNTIWVHEKKKLAEVAEDENTPGPVTSKVAEFARKNNCYVVCPLITKKDGLFYNSSLLVDRKGNIAGAYNKTHPVKSEIFPDQDFVGGGVTPGALNQPVINTDFGKVGMQICYDANWEDGWNNLKAQGAEIVFFSSAFPGGRILNYYALKNDSYIVSSTGGDARIIDMSGNDFDASSEFVRYAWATVNLEKVNVTTWPTRDVLPDVFTKYGNRLSIKVWNRTDVITIESRDPELKVAAVLKEFDIPTYSNLLKMETSVQEKYRPPMVGNK